MPELPLLSGQIAEAPVFPATQSRGDAIALANGRFATAWVDLVPDGNFTQFRTSALHVRIHDGLRQTAAAVLDVELNLPFSGFTDVTALVGGGLVVAANYYDSLGALVRQTYIFDGEGAQIGNPVTLVWDLSGSSVENIALADGGFLAVNGYTTINGSFTTDARRFDATGQPFGPTFDPSPGNGQANLVPEAELANGNIIVAGKTPFQQDDLFVGIIGPRGQVVQAARVINEGSQGLAEVISVDVAVLIDGSFVVVWDQIDNRFLPFAQEVTGLRAIVFEADGSVRIPEFTIADAPGQNEGLPAITALADGGFMLEWSRQTGRISDPEVMVQAWNADGTSAGPELLVADLLPGSSPKLTVMPDGRILVHSINAVFVAQMGDSRLGPILQTGTALGDQMVGTRWDDTLSGLAGEDDIGGGGGSDSLSGNTGSDQLYGGAGNDSINGDAGNDAVYGDAGDDRIGGGGGADHLEGGAGNDVLSGGAIDTTFDPMSAQVFRLYQATLDRDPDIGGLRAWVGQLATGRPLVQITAGFVGSAEFQARYGATSDAAFVTLLYQNVLDRTPDAGGFAAWTAALTGGRSRADVVLGFANSPEFILRTDAAAMQFSRTALAADWGDEVFRIYDATLNRVPDLPGFEAWTQALANGRPLLDVLAGFIGSAESRALYGAPTNSDFVTLLYNNVLDRAPDPGGLAGWTGQLDTAALTRAEVARGFVQSAEFIRVAAPRYADFLQNGLFSDNLSGGAGRNLLFGGLGPDTFVFAASDDGRHVVADFSRADTLDFDGFGYATTAQALSRMSQSGQDVVFADQGVQVVLVGAVLAEVTDSILI